MASRTWKETVPAVPGVGVLDVAQSDLSNLLARAFRPGQLSAHAFQQNRAQRSEGIEEAAHGNGKTHHRDLQRRLLDVQ